MDEEDDLNALFGAFDGDGNGDEDGQASVAEADTEMVEAGPGTMETPTTSKESNDESETEKQSTITTIHVPSDSRATVQPPMSNAKSIDNDPTKDSKKEAADDRQIATGTSHDKSIRTHVAYPPDKEDIPPPKKDDGRPPAKTYPFPLDPFQAYATSCIRKNESVLVAAHTSAGKTVCAEYAIAQSLRDGQRVIYTSPIKALSNQKYRDLQEEFQDVGLMTGDITINPTATCLVMTTEILRSMLYRGSELMREVAWVIYDEVHYMRDKERGVVWEESIILLPHKVRFVFLSATIPNANQFCAWIAKIHHQVCHVVYTNYRPVPLQHYIFSAGGDGLYLVVDERGSFREKNFQQAMAQVSSGANGMDAAIADAIADSGSKGLSRKKRKRGQGGGNGNTDLHRIVKLVMERGLNPVIIFSFSKKDCEKYALELNKEDYTDETEKELISQVYKNAIESLGEDDRKLPQVEALLPLLKKGIGIHHGGLLPILKEIVEILFSEGLIKCLFATETFAIGINMPAKTVVFTNTRKWDGQDFRWVTSGEYIQMSGRAGRRGKDDRGIVIQMLDEKMEPSVCKSILYGDPDPLNSSYRISYNMLLNMMRVEDVDPEYLLRASFHQFQKESEVPALENQAEELESKANANNGDLSKEQQEQVIEFYNMNQQLSMIQQKMIHISRKPEYIVPFLQLPGRMMKCQIDGEDFGWGVLVSYKKRPGGSAGATGKLGKTGPQHMVDVLLLCVDKHFDTDISNAAEAKEDVVNAGLLWRGTSQHCRPVGKDDDDSITTMRVFSIGLHNIEELSAVRLFIPNDIHPSNARKNIAKSVKEVQRRFPEGVPCLDPEADLGVKSDDYKQLNDRVQTLQKRMASHSICTNTTQEQRTKWIRDYAKKTELLRHAQVLRNQARASTNMVMRDDLKKMKRVLRHLGHVDANGVIQTKGRTACEINTADELVVVELLFCGLLNKLSVEQCVALMSCMTFDERNKSDDGDPTKGMKSYLSNPFFKLQECARSVAKASIACKVDVVEEEFVEKFNPGLMEAVFAWCKGAKFVDVQKLTGTFEGTTIRTLRRLEELIRQLSEASRAIGNAELQAKFEKGSDLLKRDIVFCSSLYL